MRSPALPATADVVIELEIFCDCALLSSGARRPVFADGFDVLAPDERIIGRDGAKEPDIF